MASRTKDVLNLYKNALVVYEESDTVKEEYAYVPVPVEVKVPVPKENYAFDLTGVYNAVTNFGNAVVKSMQIDPKTGEVFVFIAVLSVMCFVTLAMVTLKAFLP